MIEVLISMFGIVIILRILSHLRKFEVINHKKLIQFFFLFQIPIYCLIFFKELFAVTLIYIGIFLLSLMFFKKILTIFVKSTHERRSIQLIDELILLMKTGKSAQSALKISYMQMSDWEKTVFKPALFCFEHQNVTFDSIHQHQQFYFQELRQILNSTTKVIEQLLSLREGLKIQRNLRHKSVQVTKQIRAQAIVAVFIYCGIFILSWYQFQLAKEIGLIAVSISFFLTGQVLIFGLGGRVKWKT